MVEMILTVANVTKSFQLKANTITVLHNLSFQVRQGEVVSLLGPTGCGKTTTLNLIAGFLKPDSGRILFDGTEVWGPHPGRAMIFQEDATLPWLTVEGNVRFSILMCKKNLQRPIEEVVDDFLQLVGLADRRDSFPKDLSGGMKKRLEIARTFAVAPRLVLADEPFSEIDAITREDLQSKLASLNEKLGTTMVLATHDVEEALYVSDRVLIMSSAPKTRVVREVNVDFLRPREPVIKTSAKFREVFADIKKDLPSLES